MFKFQYLQVLLLLALTGSTFAACTSRVDISTQLIKFLDYPAIQQAADDAVAAIEKTKQIIDGTSGHKPPTKSLTCDRIRVRKEWRTLTRNEKKAYMIAEKCLMKLPDPGLTNSTVAKYFDGLTNVSKFLCLLDEQI